MQDKNLISVTKNEEKPMVIVFSKPYKFEDKEYESIDLSGIENVKAADMIAVNKLMNKDGGFNVMPEISLEYACHMASRVTDKPIEFFFNLPPKEAISLKNKVTSFFFGQD